MSQSVDEKWLLENIEKTLSSFLFIMSSLNNNFTSLKTNLLLTVKKKQLVDTRQNFFEIFVRKKTGGLNRFLLEGKSSEEECCYVWRHPQIL